MPTCTDEELKAAGDFLDGLDTSDVVESAPEDLTVASGGSDDREAVDPSEAGVDLILLVDTFDGRSGASSARPRRSQSGSLRLRGRGVRHRNAGRRRGRVAGWFTQCLPGGLDRGRYHVRQRAGWQLREGRLPLEHHRRRPERVQPPHRPRRRVRLPGFLGRRRTHSALRGDSGRIVNLG